MAALKFNHRAALPDPFPVIIAHASVP